MITAITSADRHRQCLHSSTHLEVCHMITSLDYTVCTYTMHATLHKIVD